MDIILNNRKEKINIEKLSITDLLKYKNFTFKMMIVKINGKLIKKDEYQTAYIKEGDNVSVLHLISGG